MDVVTSIAALRARVAGWRASADEVALVPTMGALHEGHLTLVRTARDRARRVVVSIFVNPTQFAPGEDFASYPRQEGADQTLLRAAKADLVFQPTVQAMYPEGHATRVHVAGVTETLEDDFRPGHFDGVATVVAKLLLQALPDVALFGEKDYQQLLVIRRMVRDLDIPVRIEGVQVAFLFPVPRHRSHLIRGQTGWLDRVYNTRRSLPILAQARSLFSAMPPSPRHPSADTMP